MLRKKKNEPTELARIATSLEKLTEIWAELYGDAGINVEVNVANNELCQEVERLTRAVETLRWVPVKG